MESKSMSSRRVVAMAGLLLGVLLGLSGPAAADLNVPPPLDFTSGLVEEVQDTADSTIDAVLQRFHFGSGLDACIPGGIGCVSLKPCADANTQGMWTHVYNRYGVFVEVGHNGAGGYAGYSDPCPA